MTTINLKPNPNKVGQFLGKTKCFDIECNRNIDGSEIIVIIMFWIPLLTIRIN